MEMEIDGVGGVSILAKAKVFRHGVHFPAFSFQKHAETEGFGKVSLIPIPYGHTDLTIFLDGPEDGILGCRVTSLHNLAFIRAKCG